MGTDVHGGVPAAAPDLRLRDRSGAALYLLAHDFLHVEGVALGARLNVGRRRTSASGAPPPMTAVANAAVCPGVSSSST